MLTLFKISLENCSVPCKRQRSSVRNKNCSVRAYEQCGKGTVGYVKLGSCASISLLWVLENNFSGQGVGREEGWWWLITLPYTLFSVFVSSLAVSATVRLPGGAPYGADTLLLSFVWVWVTQQSWRWFLIALFWFCSEWGSCCFVCPFQSYPY